LSWQRGGGNVVVATSLGGRAEKGMLKASAPRCMVAVQRYSCGGGEDVVRSSSSRQCAGWRLGGPGEGGQHSRRYFNSVSRSCLGKGDDGGNGGDDGNGGDGNGGEDDDDEEEYLNLQQAEELAAAKGVELPQDFAATAAQGGIRASVLSQYCAIASGGYLTSLLAKSVPAFRDRLIADRLYFFKVLVEIVIDSGCATVAEVRKRGEEFWDEFEFYLSDMLVGLVMDVVLVSLLAPVAVAGRRRKVAQSGTCACTTTGSENQIVADELTRLLS